MWRANEVHLFLTNGSFLILRNDLIKCAIVCFPGIKKLNLNVSRRYKKKKEKEMSLSFIMWYLNLSWRSCWMLDLELSECRRWRSLIPIHRLGGLNVGSLQQSFLTNCNYKWTKSMVLISLINKGTGFVGNLLWYKKKLFWFATGWITPPSCLFIFFLTAWLKVLTVHTASRSFSYPDGCQ